MTIFAQPMIDGVDDELLALSKLEATSNAIRLRIAAMAPDQLYRGSRDKPTIAEMIAGAVDREKAYLAGFTRARQETTPRLEDPQPGLSVMDRDFADDLAAFFDLRRMTLDVLRSLNDREWERMVLLPDGTTLTLEKLAIRLQRYDAQMLRTISDLKHTFLRNNGVDELRDMGVAGKLGQNIGQ